MNKSKCMRVLGRHKDWVVGATISESVNESGNIHRFVATIRGFRNWILWEGDVHKIPTQKIIEMVKTIRDRIDNGDERVFHEPQPIVELQSSDTLTEVSLVTTIADWLENLLGGVNYEEMAESLIDYLSERGYEIEDKIKELR